MESRQVATLLRPKGPVGSSPTLSAMWLLPLKITREWAGFMMWQFENLYGDLDDLIRQLDKAT